MVDILLATYNGGKYLKEQIESIVSQLDKNWRLLIHDDGSNDNTIEIIQYFTEKEKKIIHVNDGIKGLGVVGNFLHLLRFSDADFLMFCDQDDIWLSEKIKIMHEGIKNRNNEIPQAVFSNAYLWSETKGIISNKNTLTYPYKLEELLFLNSGIQGAASIFNKKTKELMLKPLDHYAMHDHLLVLAATTFGEVDYIDRPLMYYRQHAENVTGNAPGSLKNKFLLLKKNSSVPVVDKKHYNGLKAFYEAFCEEIPAGKKRIIEVFLELPTKRPFIRVILILKYRFKLFNSTLLLLLKMCFRRFSCI